MENVLYKRRVALVSGAMSQFCFSFRKKISDRIAASHLRYSIFCVMPSFTAALLACAAATNSTASFCGSEFGKAHCEGTVTFTQSCDVVAKEINARVAGPWTDPHNGGTYSSKASSATEIDTIHKTGKSPHYEDHQSFKLAASGTGCKVEVCSTSTVGSMLDFGTNFCDIHDLYCSDGACKAFTNLTYTESIKCSSGQSGAKNCY